MPGIGLGMTFRRGVSPAILAGLPTLDLDFLQQRYSMSLIAKAFADIFTFSRASTGTRINAAGAIETVAANQPRFDYEPVTLLPKGVLIEEQRTRLNTLSLSPSANETIAVSAQAYTLSFYGSGIVTLSGAHAQVVAGAGAFPARRTYTFTPSAGALTLAFSGSCADVQIEAGAFATSVIRGEGSQVTRAGDVVISNTLTPWFEAGNGVIYIEHTIFNQAPAASRIVELSNGGSQERIYIAMQSATSVRLNSSVGGTTVVAITQASPGAGSVVKTASRIKTNDFGLSTNGLDAVADVDAPSPAGLNVIRLGSANFDQALLNGHIRRLRYNKKNLSNAEIKALTA